MQYSLLSRFHGALLGAAIAEALGTNLGRSKTGLRPLQDTKLSNSPLDAQGQNQPFQLNQAAWLCAEALIQIGELDVEYLKHLQVCRQAQTQWVPLSSSETLMGIIPISLFFHEDEVRLRQRVSQAVEVGPASLELRSGALVVAYAIAQCLREQFDSSTFIPQAIAYLNQPSSSFLVMQLEQVQRLLEQRASLETAQSQLLKLQLPDSLPINTSITLAFYCFLSTLEDYRLTTARAARIDCQSPLTATLAGALSGAYNSTVGIPPGPRLTLLQTDSSQSQKRKIVETMSLIADQLLATWSGVYEPTHAFMGADLLAKPAVAAPGVIRPRI